VVAVTAAAAAAGIPTLSALQLGGAGSQVALEQQQQQGQEEQLPAGLDLSLAENDADIVGFLYRQVGDPVHCQQRLAGAALAAPGSQLRVVVYWGGTNSRDGRLWWPVDGAMLR
jgi:hypothetical protein